MADAKDVLEFLEFNALLSDAHFFIKAAWMASNIFGSISVPPLTADTVPYDARAVFPRH